MNCQNCNHQLTRPVKFCTKCGHPISHSSVQAHDKADVQHKCVHHQNAFLEKRKTADAKGITSWNKKKMLIVFSAFAVFVCFLVVSILFINNMKLKKSSDGLDSIKTAKKGFDAKTEVKTSVRGQLSLAFVGDILLAGLAGRIINKTGNVAYPFEGVKSELENADITFGNLECVFVGKTITRNVTLEDGSKRFMFLTKPEFAESLSKASFDIVNLANNHAMDGGKKGLESTIAALGKYSIAYVGGGKNKSEAYSCRTINRKGWNVGFIARSAVNKVGVAGDDSAGIAVLNDDICENVKYLKPKPDLLIVSLHWGIEDSNVPTENQRKLARKLIDCGVDMVIGHHPHVLQPLEIYKGKIIAYSLGNFVFDNPKYSDSKTMILKVKVNPNGSQSAYYIPCRIVRAKPEFTD
jgi:poly-gamma-glutamate capsule biosynthesis protein CapA/YwtB (metallophosphatase superfamily)